MRVLSIDYGTKRIGVAISDEDEMLASPLPAVDGTREAAAIDAIAMLVTEREVDAIVIGLPLHMSGAEGATAKAVRRFAAALSARVGIEVSTIDERMSTLEASRKLASAGKTAKAQRRVIDSAVAVILLETELARRAARKR